MNSDREDPQSAMRLSGELTSQDIEEIHRYLTEMTQQGDNLSLDLSTITECDAAGLQLLLALAKEIVNKGLNLRIIASSNVVTSAASHLGISLDLGSAATTSNVDELGVNRA